MSSQDFETLHERLQALMKRFVDFDIPPERDPTAEELDSIACFKLLMHSEIETYIEQRVKQAIQKTKEAWTQSRTLNRCAFHLLLRWHAEAEAASGEFKSAPRISDLDDLLNACQRRALAEIGENNSIKQAAFLRLASLAGMAADDHAPTLLAALETFGKTRGEVAHRSVGRVKVLNSPRVEASSAEQLVQLLKNFDESIDI